MSLNVNVGHTIQKLIHNTPVAISANDTTTSVVTSGGNVYQSGLISARIQYAFKEIQANENIVGHVIDTQSTENVIYLLNDAGVVFAYDYNTGACSPVIREVYSPSVCRGDPAIRIRSGSNHLVILTKKHKVWGVGDNSEYQLVPQGQCRYDIATELIVTDTNIHDNFNCCSFVGTLDELEKPCIPKKDTCNKTSCIKNKLKNVKLGDLIISPITVDSECCPKGIGELHVPVCGDIEYVGFLCVGNQCDVDGTVTYTVNNVHIPAGCCTAIFTNTTTHESCKVKFTSDHKICFNDEPCTFVTQIGAKDECRSSSSSESSSESESESEEDCCGGRKRRRHSGSRSDDDCCEKKSRGKSRIQREIRHRIKKHIKCNDNFKLCINPSCLSSVSVGQDACGIVLSAPLAPAVKSDKTPAPRSCEAECDSITHLIPLGGVSWDLEAQPTARFRLSHRIKLDCCVPCDPPSCDKDKLPQPCWMSVYAGFNTTVLVDSCNRMYVLGSIHNVRNNAKLLKRTCLEELLARTDASISLPADQLNCGVGAKNTNCVCNKNECRKPFQTDFDKFHVSLRFPQNESDCEDCCKTNSLCDFLKAFKQCNEAPHCDNTCQPCDPNIYLDVFDCGKDKPIIDTITILNKKSVCKAISQGHFDSARVCLTPDTVVEFDLNQYCVDNAEYCLSKVLILHTGAREVRKDKDLADITIYVDLDNPGSIMFSCFQKTTCVEFVVDASSRNEQFILNYGGVMDPVELANLKLLLVNNCAFPSPQYKNPICNKLFNTYVKGGDCIKFFKKREHCGTKLAVTADVPTVFRLNRRVLDIGVGADNLSVLVGGLACPNEIFAIGQNCYGELGLESHESTVCWRQVNRCLFDCQVNAIFTGPSVTLYVTQSGRVFGSGLWKCLVNSTIPVCIPAICHGWKTKKIAISKNQMVILTQDSCLFGVGDNSLGELGLCHIDCVPCPVPLPFLDDLNHYGTQNLLACGRTLKPKCCVPLYKDCTPCKITKTCCNDSGDEHGGCPGCPKGKCGCKKGGHRDERVHVANRRLVAYRGGRW